MAAVIKSIRGTRDLLPPETALWNFAEAAVRDVFRVYNFQENRTPIIEDLQLFQRSVGEETDIVAKEMFAWEDRGRRSEIGDVSFDSGASDARDRGQMLALRPENTDGVVRAYIEPWLGGVAKQMCADCQRRAVANPLRLFDCKVPADQPIIEKLPRIADYLDDTCRQHFAAVQEIPNTVRVAFTLNDRLVRGLDYYTRT